MDLRDLAGERLETRRWGVLREEASAIVLLHHGFGHAGGWGDFPQRLQSATGRSVIAYSRAGCGQSAPRRARLRRGDVFEFEATRILPALLESYGLKKACIYGHSDGGTIALVAAARRPDLVDRLITEAPHVFVEALTTGSVARIARAYAESGLRRALARQHADPDAAFGPWRDMWLDPSFACWSIERLLRNIRAPMLLVQGAEDEYGTRAQAETVHARVSGPVTTRLVAQCRHQPHAEAKGLPAWVAEFLESPPEPGKRWIEG
jgi:pimeloyl-ACP methyl ester carboxylesterase